MVVYHSFTLLDTSVTFAQNIQVQGSITDEMGETMIGVSVLIKGTASGTILIWMVILHCRFC